MATKHATASPTGPLRRLSIRAKFYLGLSIWTAGVLIFVGGYYPTRLSREFRSRLEAEADAAATLLAHHLAPAVDFEDRRAAALGIGGALQLRDVKYVGVFTRDGRLLAARGQSARSSTRVAPSDTLSVVADRLVLIRRIEGVDHQLLGALVLESSLARLHARRREDLIATATLGATILALGLLIAVILERAVVRPIKRVTAGVERVASAREEVPLVRVESDDEAGQLARAFNAMRDRLDRTTVSRDYLESVLASVADMLFVVGRDGKIRSVNRATRAALGIEESAILGRPLSDLVGPDADRLLAETRELRALTDRAVTVRGQGEPIPSLVSGASVAGSAGEVVLLARDITETRKRIAAEARAEEQQRRAAELAKAYADLEEAHRQLQEAQAKLVQSGRLAAVGELAAGVAHEMNNPLSAVLIYASLLESKLSALPEDLRQRLDGFGKQLALIAVGATRCKEISDNLLAFSRGSEAPMAVVPIATLVARTIDLIGAHFRFKRVGLTCDVPEGLSVWGSEGELQQILTNLFMNAAQAVGEGGHVAIKARAAPPDSIVLEVSDDGPGMSPEVRARIFEPFFTTKPIGKGTGLGLSIVHGLVAKHRGSIEVRTAPGEGAVFAITLPTASARGEPPPVSSPGRPA